MEEITCEIQRIIITDFPLHDDFILALRDEQTDPIPCASNAHTVQAALEALPSIGNGNVTVTGDEGAGWWAVMFKGRLAGQRLPLLQAQGFAFDGTDPVVTTEHVARGRPAYARSTIGRRLSTVVSFYKWCVERPRDPEGLPPAGRAVSCQICGDPNTVAKARCMTCWKYHRRHGTDRPDHLIIRLTEKDIERQLTQRAYSC